MIAGIGVDIVGVERIKAALSKHGVRFVKKILSDPEYEEYQNVHQNVQFLAKRFAMKEAFVKALGTGMRNGISFPMITVGHDGLGKPFLILDPALQSLIQSSRIHVSVSDEKNSVVAFSLIER